MTFGIGNERLPMQQDVEDNVGVEEDPHHPYFA